MRCETWVKWTIGLGLVCVLCLGLASRSHPAQAQQGVAQEQTGMQQEVGTQFTYQGRVLYEGVAINGTCDFEFGLWDALTGGAELEVRPASGVPVSDGYFTIELDFGSSAFTGDARFLQIIMDCGHGFALLEPRQALTAAPYAHSLRPGASVQSDTGNALNVSTAATSGAALNASASASAGNAAAVYGSSNAPSGAGISGYNSSSGYGVYGGASGSTGAPVGVYGLAGHAGSATSFGVYGKSNSSVGTGVGGEAPLAGIYGKGTASNGYGVYGEATATSGTTYGVYGKATSSSGTGVYGEGPTGVHGSSPAGAGVWGSSPSGWGVSGSSTNSHGVRGASTNGIGVYGTSPITGTAGIATASSGYGVYGEASSASGTTYGVYGKATSLSGQGVHGEGGYYGVYAVGTDPSGISYGVYGRTMSSSNGAAGLYGQAAASSGTTYGVYGQSNSAAGYGVYSAGNAHVQGDLTVSGDLNVTGNIVPKIHTTTLSIAPAAFWPWKHDAGYTNEGYYLQPVGGGPAALQPFFAPLQLPHNARITEVSACFRSERPLTSGADMRFGLERADFAGGSVTMAFEGNPGGDGQNELTCFSDDTIQDPVIDNNTCSYYVWVSMVNAAKFYGMKVEYEYAAP